MRKCEICKTKDKKLTKVKIAEEKGDLPFDIFICGECLKSFVKDYPNHT